jgi:pyruvate/2-oxoglutarate dehydrogenase complex dihydrolipoamide dehydrogenase (E3) component
LALFKTKQTHQFPLALSGDSTQILKLRDMKHYDYIIVGTGQATGVLLGKLIPEKKKIAVIEGNKIGGSCVNYGCTPTKTMVAAAKAFHTAKRGDFFGFHTGEVSLNFSRVKERMDEIRNSASNGLEEWMKSADNVELYDGYASFITDKKLKVGSSEITGDVIFINTGTRSAFPPIKGIEKVNALDSAGILDLDALPEHLMIIGGGYIGVEFAQIYNRLGAKVTLIEGAEQLMPQEDEDVANAIGDFLKDEGVNIMCNAKANEVADKQGKITVTIDHNGQEKTIEGSHLLIAAGRKPNIEKLGLENTQIEVNEKGFIKTDDVGATSSERVFALGDVNGKGAFTHTSVNDAEVVLDHLFGKGERKISDRIPVYALFTDPPLGRVGLTEKEAIERGKKVLMAVKPMSEISRAKEMGETTGFAKLLVDADTDLILGASILGAGGDEIINMFTTIMHSNITSRDYRKVVLVHPTISELMPWMLDGLKPVN